MYKNDKITDINLEIKQTGVLISAQTEVNEEIKQNLSVNKKFKKEGIKEEVLSLKKQLHGKKLQLDQAFNKNHQTRQQTEELMDQIQTLKDKIVHLKKPDIISQSKELDKLLDSTTHV
eukprot:CAMPEP_0116900552 /NCGR_PEP_ID=MMETSP0467-20121206/8785_1 /TAXON_ID=283647 /ORGANISM="Mesodinium pulex, Strain SPMC105" /LENGTH=117 /DNA_ID=CAMNT_0004573815 /DNA_START=194 /DNA_END=547 /DNA_ORIENTATION=-